MSRANPTKNVNASWEHFEHEADIGVRGIGATPEVAFAQAAIAMTAVITEPEKVNPVDCVQIECEAPDIELLFVDWLNALVYEIATRRMLFIDFDIRIDDLKLTARACGEAIDLQRHQPVVEVKGATYTMLQVKHRENGQWIAQCIVDV
jgi:tRNA nucleotidyltransferase (CCA-adding enzyme)